MKIIFKKFKIINKNLVAAVDVKTIQQQPSRKRESIKSSTDNSVNQQNIDKTPGEILVKNLDEIVDINRSLQDGLFDVIETTTSTTTM